MARSRGGRTSCESCPSLDVRKLHREGRLSIFQSFPVSWSFGDEPCGSIKIQTKHSAVILIFHFSDGERTKWRRVEQHVPITWTACALGGRRPWFLCTAYAGGRRCDRRVAKIYLSNSPIFACRHCNDLAYASQFEQIGYRGIGQAMKIRMQLGGSPNLLDPFPDKPKGLHWRTYHRLRKLHDAAESRFS